MSEHDPSENKPENAIDIFVFSNGDQNAPPRKYHLELKEITMWKGTLRHLGHSHYGIDNTDIDIYTTDGRKVEGPSELSHLKAYVAVIPPCAFIQTGYDNYLIRATRSWEKRLLKITNSMESSTKGPNKTVLPQSDLYIKINESEANQQQQPNQKEQEDDIKEKTSNRTKTNMSKVDPSKAKKLQECNKIVKGPIGNKQIKKSSFTSETNTLKTQIFTPFKISSAAKKSVIKTKESLQTKSSAPKKAFPLNQKRNTTRTKCFNNNCDNLIEKSIKPSIITSLNVLAKTSENISPSPITLPNLKETQDFVTKISLPNEENSIYKNTETEILSITEQKHDGILNESFKNNLDNEVLSISDKSGYNTSIVHVKESSKISLISANSENKKHIQGVELNCPVEKGPDVGYEPPPIACHNCIPNQRPIENFVAIVNNDKMLKIQLNLEIENGNLALKNESIVKKTHSIKSILKEEKEIQVNLYEESNIVHEHVHAHFPKSDFIKNVSDDGKIIIIHCSCFDNINLNHLLQSNISHNQMCQCEVIPEVKKTDFEKAEEMRCDCETKPPKVVTEESLAATEFTSAHNVAKGSLNTVITSEAEFVKCTSDVYSETMKSREMTTCPITEGNKLDLFISRHTQTNWCSIILQAVRRECGRYSLHLPPLHTVKNMADSCE